jgi:hypothetical protein
MIQPPPIVRKIELVDDAQRLRARSRGVGCKARWKQQGMRPWRRCRHAHGAPPHCKTPSSGTNSLWSYGCFQTAEVVTASWFIWKANASQLKDSVILEAMRQWCPLKGPIWPGPTQSFIFSFLLAPWQLQVCTDYVK